MKQIFFTFSIIASLIILLSSCRKDADTKEMSEEEAIESIEQFVAEESGGYAEYLVQLIEIYQETNNNCNYSSDSTITRSRNIGLTTYNSIANYAYTLSCVNGTPDILTITTSASRDFDAPRVSASANTTTSNTTLSNLITGTAFEYNGTYALSGDITSKIRQRGAFDYNFSMTSSRIMIDKSTQKITGGTATVTFSGGVTGINNIPFSYTGTITFNGNGTATLVLQGNNYTITIS